MRIQEGCSFVLCAYMVQYIVLCLLWKQTENQRQIDIYLHQSWGGAPPPLVKSWRGKRGPLAPPTGGEAAGAAAPPPCSRVYAECCSVLQRYSGHLLCSRSKLAAVGHVMCLGDLYLTWTNVYYIFTICEHVQKCVLNTGATPLFCHRKY